ncbi:hypothetical protein Glove_519g66 [Diversispora epigaea]|uniref:DUF7721 domain-containing protein n=1 Tax=Diversispora epigaea TaxID=1348612 RepID=A0A397GHF8_9GLOM|nr:hypothetical protein Glove_519g66 [Diversispora epigaea]
MNFLAEAAKKKFLHDDDDNDEEGSSFSKYAKNFGHSDEDVEHFQNVASKTHENLSTGEHDTEIDHENILDNHKKIYESDSVSEHSEKDLGHAAAFEALKKLATGKSNEIDKKALVSLAMSEGLKMWEKKQSDPSSGNSDESKGSKDEILSQACTMAMKLINTSDKKGNDGEKEESDNKLLNLANSFFQKG